MSNDSSRAIALELAINHLHGTTAEPSVVVGTATAFLAFIDPLSTAAQAAAPTVSQPAAPKQAAVSQTPPPAAQTAKTPVAPAVSYETDVGPNITAVSRAGSEAKAAVVALLGKYGAKRGPEVKNDDLPAFHKELLGLVAKHVKAA